MQTCGGVSGYVAYKRRPQLENDWEPLDYIIAQYHLSNPLKMITVF